jgi:hypothetical protein
MKSLLPNCRFLSLASEHLGRDWLEKSQEIDGQLDSLGMDLAEESVYLLFDRAPGSVLAGEALCQVARSVIGPKKELTGELRMNDWVQTLVHRKALTATDWSLVLKECYIEWENLQRQSQKIAASFMIVAKRRLTPELVLSLEVLFHG